MSPIELYSKEERKTNGVFYTPHFLAEYLAKKIIQYTGKEKIKHVIDPACGNSILLQHFYSEYLKKRKASLTLVGIDKDINAIISSTSIFADNNLKKDSTTFVNTDGLFPVKGKNSEDGWHELKDTLNCTNGFDAAISNPPWGAELNGYDPLTLNFNFSLARGQFDIFDLFVESVINNLKDNGIFGFILPDSIFSQEQAKFRCLLSKNTTIYLIARLGEKIFPEINRACVIIIGRKAKPRIDHQVDCLRLSAQYKKKILTNELTLDQVEKDLSHKVPQTRFCENEDCVFDIDLKIDEQETFDKIQINSLPIKTYVKNTRGAEISKKGLICQCPNCKKWMPLPKSKCSKCNNCKSPISVETIVKEQIVLNHNGVGNLKFKAGEDIFRYTSISKSWINTAKEGINYKKLSVYEGNKILVRKTGVGVTASLDYENSVTTQVVYILKLKPLFNKALSLEFVLAVLNSRAMTYYLIKKFGENEWRSHPYLTQKMLIELPFPKIDLACSETQRIINKVTKVVRDEIYTFNQKNISISNDIFIEKVIADLFQLNETDYNAIFDTLASAEPLIPIKRLLNFNSKDMFQENGV